MANLHRGFEDVDQSTNQELLFKFLDRVAELPAVSGFRDRMLELCPITNGLRVLDVGCGLGHEVRRLASFVGKEGTIVGLDKSAEFIEEARRRIDARHEQIEFVVGEAEELKFEDASFDICRCERVLLYVPNPARAIAEMGRVTRPGGKVIIFDFDHNAFFCDSNLPDLARKIEFLIRSVPKNPSLSHVIPYMMRRAELSVDTIEPAVLRPPLEVAQHLLTSLLAGALADGELTDAEFDAWWQDQEAMDASGEFCYLTPGYLIVATKP